MEDKRVFLGIKCPDLCVYEYLKELTSLFNGKITLVFPELYHITLHFFGNLKIDQIDILNQKLQTLSINKFELEFGITGIFPKNQPSNANVLIITPIKGSKQIIGIHQKISKILKLLNYPVEKRPFNPHLTVARVKYGSQRSELAKTWLSYEIQINESIPIDHFSLFESKLSTEGPKYIELYNY
ncbi:MAG: RNA 2',3'-cyclic phosphodiesterase [Candidatus Heimdallarchaeota archaeon]|nr:RNA 2',3'-cyclic phosphodiesterase [Candidatus Heimdallarchaeota archaeon]MDH5646629.1 RNA 2',3'-cyclic phosphodiesterase [Candidatus Heimdallarchaeota archaeon]